jgi:type II secretory pathway pseudopilin PulG
MSTSTRRPTGTRNRGFSYVEVLLAVALVSLCLVPALDALRAGTLAPTVFGSLASDQDALSSRLVEVLGTSFEALDAAATAAGSPTVPTSHSTSAVQVYLARYDLDDADADGNRFTGGDEGILWVKVASPGKPDSLETLVGR